MDQLIYASLSHTHYWYEVGMLKVPAVRTFVWSAHSAEYMDTVDRETLPMLLVISRTRKIYVVSWVGKINDPCPRSHLRSGETDPVIQSHSLHTQAEYSAYILTGPPAFRDGVHQSPSSQSLAYHVTQLRADSVFRRHEALILNVARAAGAAYPGNP